MQTQVVSWNIRRRKAPLIWEYLPDSNLPSIACLQEVRTSEPESPNFVRSEIYKRRWGTGILTRDIPLQPLSLATDTHPGTVTISSFTPPDGQPITLISLYGLMLDGRSITTLHRIFSDLTPILGRSRKRVILGGDFNASTQFDKPPKYQSHRILFDRVRNFGMIDCLPDAPKGTWRAPQKTLQYYQLDYLFVSQSIHKKLISCDVVDSAHLHAFSDHNPVVAVFDL